MKPIVWVVLVILGAAIAVMFAREARQPAAPEQATHERGSLVAAPVIQDATERIKVTARGRGIEAADATGAPIWAHNDTLQRPIDVPGLIRDADRFPGKIGLNIGDFRGMVTVAMDSTANDEGNLIRIHVDRPGQGNGHSGQLVVVGIYDALGSPDAITGQRYSCKKCGQVTVCGVSPECD